jgi:adenosine kinase
MLLVISPIHHQLRNRIRIVGINTIISISSNTTTREFDWIRYYSNQVINSRIPSKMSSSIVIVGMENPLLDISVELPDHSLLDKYGLKLDSAILAEEKHLPLYKELVDNYQPKYIAGGSTQNSIRVAQWMLKAVGKADATAFMGCIGNDDFGRQLDECATKDGVRTHYMVDETTPTGKCACLIVDGERSLCTDLQAANNFKPSHLSTDLAKNLIQNGEIFYSSGFFLTVSVESYIAVADHVATNNKIQCLNLSAPFIVEFFGDNLATALEYADFLFGNESEAETYAKKHGLGEDLKEVALAIAALPKKNCQRSRTVVFTQGSKSTIVACDGTVTEYAVNPLPKEQIVDTNGAGDAFVGGFLSQLVQGKSTADAVLAGHWASRYIIQHSGTQLPTECTYK